MATRLVPINLGYRSATGRYGLDGACRLTNAYAEAIGDEGKVKLAIYCADGLTRLSTLTGTGGVRAMLALSDDELLVVAGRLLHRIDAAGTATVIGGIASDGPVSMAANRVGQVAICCDGYQGVYAAGALTDITDPDLRPSNSVTEIDGYLVFTQSDGGWQVSGADDLTFDALDVATAESNRDGLVRGIKAGRDLLLFGTRSLEAWQNTGNDTGVPFSRTTAYDIGCASARSIAVIDQAVGFIAHDKTVRLMEGLQARIISGHDVERLIAAESDVTAVTGHSWTAGGHTFYALVGSTWCKVYDIKTGFWHDRSSKNRARWRCGASTLWRGAAVYGDIDYGRVYLGSPSVNTEDTDELIWTSQVPPLSPFPGRAICAAVYANFVTGVGVNNGVSQDVSPSVMFDVSRDGGATFGAQRMIPLGAQGQTNTRVVARRLGVIPPQGATFRWSISAAVARCLMEVSAELETLKP